MILQKDGRFINLHPTPRTRGDDPYLYTDGIDLWNYSPHTRG